MILVSYVYGIYSLFKAISIFGIWALFLMPPVWFIFCYLTGVPGIINILRTKSYLPKNEVIGGVIANITSASFLFLFLKFANIQELQSNFLIGGIITAFAMPKVSLVSEINDRKNEAKNDQ